MSYKMLPVCLFHQLSFAIMGCNKTLWLLALFIAASSAARTFHGDQVLSIQNPSESQLETLRHLEGNSELDFWSHPSKAGKSVNIHVTADQLSSVKYFLKAHNISFKVKVSDLQRLVDAEKDGQATSQFNGADVLNRYGSQSEIYSWLEDIAKQCGDRCTLMPFGTSVEGRDMKILKIVASGSGGRSKPAVFVDGGIHAREWISPVFVNNMIDKFVNQYDTDVEIQKMLEAYDWYIIPLLNPDGYQYSHDSDRMWRKNRATTRQDRCPGVDLNRNFGYEFAGKGTSNNPCSEIYRGPSAFSEPESQALRDFIQGLNVKVYLSFHSYGQYFLFPWGYDRVIADNHDDLAEVGQAAANAIDRLSWIVGNAAIELYPAAGASDDWAYSQGATYAYCIELPPDDSGDGFLLPESKIPEVLSSVWPGVKAMMQTIMQKEGAKMKQTKITPRLSLSQQFKMAIKKRTQAMWKPQYL